MANTCDKVTKIANGEVGYLEKKTPKYLEFKTKNAGSNNYTKYGKWYGANGVYWCCIFISWLFYKAFGFEKGKKILGKYSAACEDLRSKFINDGRYKKNPKVGYVVFFEGSRHSGANHIEYVYKVTSTHIYTIGGNTSGASGVIDNGGGVAKKSYAIGYEKIMGYGAPKYDTSSKEVKAAAKNDIANPTLRRGMQGAEVKKLQKNLNAIGIALSVDGIYGEQTENSVKTFQNKHSLKIDGIYGKNTYTWLNKVSK